MQAFQRSRGQSGALQNDILVMQWVQQWLDHQFYVLTVCLSKLEGKKGGNQKKKKCGTRKRLCVLPLLNLSPSDIPLTSLCSQRGVSLSVHQQDRARLCSSAPHTPVPFTPALSAGLIIYGQILSLFYYFCLAFWGVWVFLCVCVSFWFDFVFGFLLVSF